MARSIVIIIISLLLSITGLSQRVGIVLSGGGATGFAHIGVLKALEENNIPIDYITGTSSGALIGGLYASGYSPRQIDSLAHTDQFKDMVLGRVDDKYVYYYKDPYPDASWVTIKFFKDSIIQTSLPTNLISSTMIDFELMARFSGPAAAANYNFDSLFIPFRCLASDIESKQSVVFCNGHLNQSVRASMSFPFYLPPITIDGKVLFDGGLYNNFPADVMDETFNPDVIIGSNVSYNAPPPSEENLMNQVTNMIVKPTDFRLPSEKGLIISPNTDDVGTFEFEEIDQAIQAGYEATLKKIDSIRMIVPRTQDSTELARKRHNFLKKCPELVFDTLTIEGLSKNQEKYVKRVISKKRKVSTLEEIKPDYFHVAMDDKIKFILPTAIYNKNTGKYRMHLDVRKEREIEVEFGGNFSSRPINTGFIGFKYQYLGKVSALLEANSYFGKFYGSVFARSRLDVPGSFPFTIEPSFTLNRWDYFKSAATFFEDVKPSFIVRNENFTTLRLISPVGNRSKLGIDARYAELDLKYYQTDNFLSIDTADVTQFYPGSIGLQYEWSTLNRKQYPNIGTYLSLRVRGMRGKEITIPGSTAAIKDTVSNTHAWVYAQLKYMRFFLQRSKVRMGIYGEATWSSQKFFNNYTATILATPAFQPIPESKTLFIPDHRAHQYLAGGLKLSYSVGNNLEWRVEGYMFQPVVRILKDFDLKPYYSEEFDNRYFIGSTALVYNTFLGPLSLSLNYYDAQQEPFSLLFSFGYIIFNERALE